MWHVRRIVAVHVFSAISFGVAGAKGHCTRLRRFLSTGILATLVLLGLPLHAAAQFTLTGHLVEQIPGGGTPESSYLSLYRVHIDGDRTYETGVENCYGGATTDCVQPDGRFTVTDVPSGLYLVLFRTVYDNGTHMDKRFNVSIGGNTDIGVVPLLRTPFNVDMTMGQIPSSGGSIPLTVRVQTRWDIPALPVTASFLLEQDGADGETLVFWAPSIDLIWPAGLADSGVVALPPINVNASAPAGARSCAYLSIVLRNQPDVILGRASECRGKQP